MDRETYAYLIKEAMKEEFRELLVDEMVKEAVEQARAIVPYVS